MVNPVLTVLFDLFLVGSAITVIAAMVQEYFDNRSLAIGGDGQVPRSTQIPHSHADRQRPSLRKVA